MDKIWIETLERITALERIVDALAARLAKLDPDPDPETETETEPKPE